nr:Chain T, RPL21 [Schizosaccharomyces pombe]
KAHFVSTENNEPVTLHPVA